MNVELVAELIRVTRNSFTDKSSGKEVKYCKFITLTNSDDTENSCGYDIGEYTTKYENYDKLASLLKTGKSVTLKCDYVKQLNGLYRIKVLAVNDTSL